MLFYLFFFRIVFYVVLLTFTRFRESLYFMFIFILFVVAATNHADDVVACVILAIVALADVVIGNDYIVDDVAVHDVITGLVAVAAVAVAVVDAKYLGNAL